MFEVLAFVYENYWGGDACPELPALQRKLHAVGFDDHEVIAALLWLEDLKSATRRIKPPGICTVPLGPPGDPRELAVDLRPAAKQAMRILTPGEQNHLGTASWGWLIYLSSIGILPHERFELVMERAMAAPGDPVSVEDLKLIVLMVFWSLGEEPEALVLDELCDNRPVRLAS